MKKNKKMKITVLIVILLLTSIIPTFAISNNFTAYSYTVAGDESIIRIIVDNDSERVVERITTDGTVLITTYDKINNTLMREEKNNDMFDKSSNKRIEIDLNIIEERDNITPSSIDEETEEFFRSSIFGTYMYRRTDIITSLNHDVHLQLSIKDDSLISRPLVYSNPTDRHIITKGLDFRYFVINADLFGNNYSNDLSEAMFLAGSVKGHSEIRSFVTLVSIGLAQSIQSANSRDYEGAMLDFLFTFTDVAIPFTSFALRGSVVAVNVYNCNDVFNQIKNLL